MNKKEILDNIVDNACELISFPTYHGNDGAFKELFDYVKNQMSELNHSKWNEYQVKIEEGVYQKIQRFKPMEW